MTLPKNLLSISQSALLDHSFETAERILKENGTIFPTWILVHPDGGWDLMITPWSDDRDRLMMLSEVVKHMVKNSVVRYAQYSETWVISIGKDEPFRRPSKDPARREALTFTCVDLLGPKLGRTYDIFRDPLRLGDPLEIAGEYDPEEKGNLGGDLARIYEDMENGILQMNGLKRPLSPEDREDMWKVYRRIAPFASILRDTPPPTRH